MFSVARFGIKLGAYFQTITINPHYRFARHYASARHYVNLFPLNFGLLGFGFSWECFLGGREDVRLRAGRYFCFWQINWNQTSSVSRFEDHLSGCNKRGAQSCQVWSRTSTFLSTWNPDAFSCADQTTCLWLPLFDMENTWAQLVNSNSHRLIKKEQSMSPGFDFCSFSFSCPAQSNTGADVN